MDKRTARKILLTNAKEEEVDAFFLSLHMAGYNEAIEKLDKMAAEVIIALEQGDIQEAIDILTEKDLDEIP